MSIPRTIPITLWLVLSVVMGFGLLAASQPPLDSWIRNIGIPRLDPLKITFIFNNSGTVIVNSISGEVTLSDQLGQAIEVMKIDPFSVLPGESRVVSTTSAWSFQQAGVYLVEIALGLSGGAFISNSLTFQILPVQLPLEPQPPGSSEELLTVYQQPVNWGIQRISASDAWTITHGRSDVVVAIIDSGIDTSIPQLAASLWVNPGEIPDNGIDDDDNGYVDDIHGWDFRDKDNSSLTGSNIHWSGTFIAGIVAAQPGDVPIVGVAPGVRIMDVRFLDTNNQFSSQDWNTFADSIDYAVDNGADIINLSICTNGRPPATLEDAIRRATESGVVIIGMAGNTGQTGVLYPGKYEDVYVVSATTKDNLLASFSSRGPEVSFCAPGEGITSFLPGGQTATRSGTSFAAPHVTGVLALILSAFPSLSPTQAVDVLMGSLLDLGPQGFDSSFGYGLINALEAVND